MGRWRKRDAVSGGQGRYNTMLLDECPGVKMSLVLCDV